MIVFIFILAVLTGARIHDNSNSSISRLDNLIYIDPTIVATYLSHPQPPQTLDYFLKLYIPQAAFMSIVLTISFRIQDLTNVVLLPSLRSSEKFRKSFSRYMKITSVAYPFGFIIFFRLPFPVALGDEISFIDSIMLSFVYTGIPFFGIIIGVFFPALSVFDKFSQYDSE